jgi:hypothetical protein
MVVDESKTLLEPIRQGDCIKNPGATVLNEPQQKNGFYG